MAGDKIWFEVEEEARKSSHEGRNLSIEQMAKRCDSKELEILERKRPGMTINLHTLSLGEKTSIDEPSGKKRISQHSAANSKEGGSNEKRKEPQLKPSSNEDEKEKHQTQKVEGSQSNKSNWIYDDKDKNRGSSWDRSPKRKRQDREDEHVRDISNREHDTKRNVSRENGEPNRGNNFQNKGGNRNHNKKNGLMKYIPKIQICYDEVCANLSCQVPNSYVHHKDDCPFGQEHQDQRYLQNQDQRYPRGQSQNYSQGIAPRYNQGSRPGYPQGQNQRFHHDWNPRYSQNQGQRYHQDSHPRYPQNQGLRYPPDSHPRHHQTQGQRYPQTQGHLQSQEQGHPQNKTMQSQNKDF